MVDSARFFWTGRSEDMPPFAAIGARASEIQGAMLNAQLDRLPGLLAKLRSQKDRIMAATVGIAGLAANPRHSPDDECGTYLHYLLPTANAAQAFADGTGGTIAARTGRHNYTEWDPILSHRAGHHPRLNPYLWPENEACRKDYSLDMCAPSLAILSRTVMITARTAWTGADVEALIERIAAAARAALSIA